MVNLGGRQNPDEPNLDAHQTFRRARRWNRGHQPVAVNCSDPNCSDPNCSDVVVGAELRHQLKTGYCLDVVGAELRRQLKMDYCLDVELRSESVLARSRP